MLAIMVVAFAIVAISRSNHPAVKIEPVVLLCISTIDHVTNISCYERLNVLLFLPSEINVHSVERMVEYVGVRGIVCCKNNATPYAPHPTHRNQHLISQKGIYTVALMICKIAGKNISLNSIEH